MLKIPNFVLYHISIFFAMQQMRDLRKWNFTKIKLVFLPKTRYNGKKKNE